ncbi:unnamed protein product [Cochlearia groenlandica]
MELIVPPINPIMAQIIMMLIVVMIYNAFVIYIWKPLMLTRKFKKQGISGPNYRIFYGNLTEIKKMKLESQFSILDRTSNDVYTRVFPYYKHWISQYGEPFLYWNGTEPRICISDPELVKLILTSKLGYFIKGKLRPEFLNLVGNKGLVFIEGVDWVLHRKILNPAFSVDRVKLMTKAMVDSTQKMLKEWRNHTSDSNALMVNREFSILTADIIATAAFGSSYKEGIVVFKTQEELIKCCAVSLSYIFIPGTQYLPTPSNIRIWKLDRKLKRSVKKIVDSRLQHSKSDYGDDLLGIMLKSEGNQRKLNIEEIIDECRTFFFAGHESTANLLTWTTMLLSLHKDWQEKLRQEIFEVCGQDQTPDSDTFSKLIWMNMVVMESLRLYGPALFLSREAAKDVKLGNLDIPKGTTVIIPILKMHRDKAVWGEDADEFNPMRFENGVSKAANHPNAFLAFSVGPRFCIGQNFAMIEAKTVLTMILQRFRFSLSGEYKHAPVDHLNVQPQYGVPVIIQPL